MAKNSPVIAILASGAASRFGGGKLQAELNGAPLAAYAIDMALSCKLPVAIVGRDDEAAFWRNRFPSCSFVANPIATRGIGTSIRCAAHWASIRRAEGLILLLADMPFVSMRLIAQLKAALGNGQRAASRYPDSRLGVPAAFPAGDFQALTQISENRGAKHLLAEAKTLILRPPPEMLVDIDTKADLASAHRQLAGSCALENL